MARSIEYSPLPHQEAFHRTTKPITVLSTGFGGGKTYSLSMHGFQLQSLNPGIPGGLLCPDFKMYKRDVLPTIRAICRDNSIPYSYNKSDHTWEFPDSGCLMYVFSGADDGESIKGPNLGWGLINEINLISRMAFNIFMSRLRIKQTTLVQVAASGTPEGFNWVYEDLVESARSDVNLVFGNARDNTHVHESYFGHLESLYDPLLQQQYIDGKFVNILGRQVVHAFDRRKHVRPHQYDPNAEVRITVDFNVDPMSATLFNWYPATSHADRRKTGEHYAGFDEIRLSSSDTWTLMRVVKEKLKGRTMGVSVYPDPAGRARSTRTEKTDHDIIKLSGYQDLRYRTKFSVRDQVNSLNAALSKGMLTLDPKCKNAIADMEQCIWEEGKFEINKRDSSRTHWVDSIKAMIYYDHPIVRKKPVRVERIR